MFGKQPVLWIGRVAVVSLPVEVDIANADQVRQDLVAALDSGASTLIANMSATTFCDSAGVSALVQVYRLATASGAGMRLTAAAPNLRKVLAITGVDSLIDIHPSVAASLAADNPPTAENSLAAADRPGPDGTPGPGRAATPACPGDSAAWRG